MRHILRATSYLVMGVFGIAGLLSAIPFIGAIIQLVWRFS
jgi:hypothetical protein